MMTYNLHTYFIMGSTNANLAILEEALQAGITLFQLREKGKSAKTGDDLLQFAKACQHLCQQYNVPFIVNDDVPLAIALQADGIHIGQDDAHAATVRKQLPHAILGVSAHNKKEIKQAVLDGADYVGIGPIFTTASKDDAQQPCGIETLQALQEAFPRVPKVAIGGITTDNVQAVRATGVNGVAVISAISAADDVKAAVTSLRNM